MSYIDGHGAGTDLEQREHALLLIPAPSDRTIDQAFRCLAQRWHSNLTHEQLWIEGNVPVSPHFASTDTPPALHRLMDADRAMISKIEATIEPLQITYVRSGGHLPFRESYFDEIRLAMPANATPADGLRDIIASLVAAVPVSTYHSTPLLKNVLDDAIGSEKGHLDNWVSGDGPERNDGDQVVR